MKLLDQVEPEDLMKYGLIPEFIGRLPVLSILERLDEAALVRILSEPKNALTKQYEKLFELEGVSLDLRENALQAIAKQAIKRKSGARGLRSIVEHLLLHLMYEIPSMEHLEKVVIDETVVEKSSDPVFVYNNNGSDKQSIAES